MSKMLSTVLGAEHVLSKGKLECGCSVPGTVLKLESQKSKIPIPLLVVITYQSSAESPLPKPGGGGGWCERATGSQHGGVLNFP